MHGVGQEYIMDCLSAFQFEPFISVDLQVNYLGLLMTVRLNIR